MKPVMKGKAMKRVLPVMRRADTDKLVQLEKENARLRAKLKITLNALKYVRDAWDTLLEGEVADEILPAIEIGEEE